MASGPALDLRTPSGLERGRATFCCERRGQSAAGIARGLRLKYRYEALAPGGSLRSEVSVVESTGAMNSDHGGVMWALS